MDVTAKFIGFNVCLIKQENLYLTKLRKYKLWNIINRLACTIFLSTYIAYDSINIFGRFKRIKEHITTS